MGCKPSLLLPHLIACPQCVPNGEDVNQWSFCQILQNSKEMWKFRSKGQIPHLARNAVAHSKLWELVIRYNKLILLLQ